jgi:hypothetical protein
MLLPFRLHPGRGEKIPNRPRHAAPGLGTRVRPMERSPDAAQRFLHPR